MEEEEIHEQECEEPTAAQLRAARAGLASPLSSSAVNKASRLQDLNENCSASIALHRNLSSAASRQTVYSRLVANGPK